MPCCRYNNRYMKKTTSSTRKNLVLTFNLMSPIEPLFNFMFIHISVLHSGARLIFFLDYLPKQFFIYSKNTSIISCRHLYDEIGIVNTRHESDALLGLPGSDVDSNTNRVHTLQFLYEIPYAHRFNIDIQ